MKRVPLILIFLAILAPSLSWSRIPDKPVSRNAEAQKLVDAAWACLDDDQTLETIDCAISNLEKARDLDPNNHEILTELACEYFDRAYYTPGDTDEEKKLQTDYNKKSFESATRALEIKETAGAHYLAAAAQGKQYQYASYLKQAAVFPEILGHLKWLDEKAPHYKYGVSARFWTGILAKAPEIFIKMLGKDSAAILDDLQSQIDKNPNYVENYVWLAQYYGYIDKKDLALDALEAALKVDPCSMPGEVGSNKMNQRVARGLWKEISGKEYPNR